MQYIALIIAAAATFLAGWQNHLYAFMFGCTWMVVSAIILGAEKIVNTMLSNAEERQRLVSEELRKSQAILERLNEQRAHLGEQVGRAISGATYRSPRRLCDEDDA